MTLLSAVPTIGAKFFLGQADGRYQIVKGLVLQRGQVESLADALHHGAVFFAVRISIMVKVRVAAPFQFFDGLRIPLLLQVEIHQLQMRLRRERLEKQLQKPAKEAENTTGEVK